MLNQIDHVAIAVHDLEAAIEYYGRAFGAEVCHREIVERDCLLYTSPSPRDRTRSRMPSSA